MIAGAIGRFKRLQDAGVPGVLVAFSGGKDSWATLDIACRVFTPDRVRTFFLYVIPDLECEESQIRLAKARYGVDPIRLPHPELAGYLRGSILRDRRGSLETAFRRKLTWKDVETVARERSGYHWIAAGHRSCDSLHRRGMINQSDDGIAERYGKLWPICDWHPKHVFAYLKSRRIPVPTMFGAGSSNTSGVNPLSVSFLLHLKQHWPDDYSKVRKMFPHVDDLIFRDELRAKHAIQENSGEPG